MIAPKHCDRVAALLASRAGLSNARDRVVVRSNPPFSAITRRRLADLADAVAYLSRDRPRSTIRADWPPPLVHSSMKMCKQVGGDHQQRVLFGGQRGE